MHQNSVGDKSRPKRAHTDQPTALPQPVASLTRGVGTGPADPAAARPFDKREFVYPHYVNFRERELIFRTTSKIGATRC